jgi:hypothetical protein
MRKMKQPEWIVQQPQRRIVEVNYEQNCNAAHKIEFDLASKGLFRGGHPISIG